MQDKRGRKRPILAFVDASDEEPGSGIGARNAKDSAPLPEPNPSNSDQSPEQESPSELHTAPQSPLNGQPDTESRERFAQWLSRPPELRDPPTQKELQKVLGKDRKTLWRWERDPQVLARVEELQSRVWDAELPEVIRALASAAKSGERWAVELFLKLALPGGAGKTSGGGPCGSTKAGGGLPSTEGLTSAQLKELQVGLVREMGLTPVEPGE